VWINPQEFQVEKKKLKALENLTGVAAKTISNHQVRYKNQNREFAYIKRAVPPDVAQQIKALSIPGVYLQQDYRRYYPEGEVSSHLIGFTNIDDEGQEGLELAYNSWLQGEPGKKWVIKDRLGRVISDVETIQDQKPGGDLTLSIDRRIQYLAYRELLAGTIEAEAVSGSVIVLDAQTGEILAMVNVPSYNPNNRKDTKPAQLRNRAVTDTFEPGSTLKVFSVAAALASGKFKPDTIIDTSPGWLRVGHDLVRDEHGKGPMTVAQILQKSSNVGVTKMLLELPADTLWTLLHDVGFGSQSNATFPGEQGGSLVKHHPWGAFTIATLGFGYGMSANTLQLAQAFSVFANQGVKKPVFLLKQTELSPGQQVLDAKIARQMLDIMEVVVSRQGTARKAAVPGYRVAGKTGTARKVGQNGYQKHVYTSMFVGIAPVSQPRLVVAVVLHEPRGKLYYGGDVAAPIFSKVMEGSLRMMNIAPDEASLK
jgi:cell division protein FtsI (penicillin-binding protein 3)